MSEGGRSNPYAITRSSEGITRSTAEGVCKCRCCKAAQTNSTESVGVAVDQPPLAVGVRFPLCPPETEKTEGTSEESDPSEIGEGGQAALPLVRSVTSISPDDRIYAAIARRGDMSIAAFLRAAYERTHSDWPEGWPGHFDQEHDSDLALMCESLADSL